MFTKVFRYQAQVVQTTNPQFGVLWHSLNTVTSNVSTGTDDFAALTKLYDQYKICSIRSSWMPSIKSQNVNASAASSIDSTARTATMNDIPMLFVNRKVAPNTINYPEAFNYNSLQELNGVRKVSQYRRFNVYTPTNVGVSIDFDLSAGALGTAPQKVSRKASWYDIYEVGESSPNGSNTISRIPHGFTLYYIPAAATANALAGILVPQLWNVDWTIKVKFRGKK